MKEKWLEQEVFPKSIIISLIYSLVMIIIGLILVVINTSYLYGVLVGVLLLYISYLIIWVLWYKIKPIKTHMAKMTGVWSPVIRITVFIFTMLLIVFFINTGEGLDSFIQPINIVMMLITYTFVTMLSLGTTHIIDSYLENKK